MFANSHYLLSQPSQHCPVQDAAATAAAAAAVAAASSNSERHDFESFARHLQDAAMLIQRQAERPPYDYSHVSVLLLRWADDPSSEADLSALDQLFRDSYYFRTQRWLIPSGPNPSLKLAVQIASFLDNPRPHHLHIIYYAGHGFVGKGGQLHWAW